MYTYTYIAAEPHEDGTIQFSWFNRAERFSMGQQREGRIFAQLFASKKTHANGLLRGFLDLQAMLCQKQHVSPAHNFSVQRFAGVKLIFLTTVCASHINIWTHQVRDANEWDAFRPFLLGCTVF